MEDSSLLVGEGKREGESETRKAGENQSDSVSWFSPSLHIDSFPALPLSQI